MIVIKQHVKY